MKCRTTYKNLDFLTLKIYDKSIESNLSFPNIIRLETVFYPESMKKFFSQNFTDKFLNLSSIEINKKVHSFIEDILFHAKQKKSTIFQYRFFRSISKIKTVWYFIFKKQKNRDNRDNRKRYCTKNPLRKTGWAERAQYIKMSVKWRSYQFLLYYYLNILSLFLGGVTQRRISLCLCFYTVLYALGLTESSRVSLSSYCFNFFIYVSCNCALSCLKRCFL